MLRKNAVHLYRCVRVDVNGVMCNSNRGNGVIGITAVDRSKRGGRGALK